jgi:CheY-like chemotaxis protein
MIDVVTASAPHASRPLVRLAPDCDPATAVPTARPILIVEDNPGMLALLEAAVGLEGGDHAVVGAATGEEALVLAERVRPRLVLLDLVLPGLDGYEVARRLRANPTTRDCWIIAVSSPGSPDRAVRAGCDAFLRKPFKVADVAEAVRFGLARLQSEPAPDQPPTP